MNQLVTISNENNHCKIAGAVSFSTVLELRIHGFELIKQFNEVIFDFSEVTHSDSSAIALLLNFTRFANEQKKTIAFVDLPQQLLDIASLCGVLSFLNYQSSSTNE